MNEFRNAMRRMRKFTDDVEKNFRSRDTEIKKLDDFKGSCFYDKEVSNIDSKIEESRIKLTEAARKDLIALMGDMRKNVGNRITKAPTADMVNSLTILGMLDKMSPTDIRQYAAQMADCPLAMKRLQQIANTHSIQIMAPDTEAMMRCVDVLEGNFANYLQGYTGNPQSMTTSVKQLHDLYFQPEEYYMKTPLKSCANADNAFWQNIIGFATPAVLDGTGETAATDVKYFFSSMDGFLEFIDKETEGLEGKAHTDAINSILNDCPGQYGAAYRYYKATGEKVPLNAEVEHN